MLTPNKDIYCGLFDSSITRQNTTRSPKRRVERYEIELFHVSSGVSHVDSSTYEVKRGMLLFAKPGQIRFSDLHVKCSFIRIDPHCDAQITDILNTLPNCVYLDDSSEIDNLLGKFTRLGSAFLGYQGSDCEDLKINSIFLDILYRCKLAADKSLAEKEHLPANQAVSAVYEYINEHFCDPELSIETVCREKFISASGLQRAFKNRLGISPKQYIDKLRMSRSLELLTDAFLSVKEIAFACGFKDEKYFSRAFKNKYGHPPSQFRKNLCI